MCQLSRSFDCLHCILQPRGTFLDKCRIFVYCFDIQNIYHVKMNNYRNKTVQVALFALHINNNATHHCEYYYNHEPIHVPFRQWSDMGLAKHMYLGRISRPHRTMYLHRNIYHWWVIQDTRRNMYPNDIFEFQCYKPRLRCIGMVRSLQYTQTPNLD